MDRDEIVSIEMDFGWILEEWEYDDDCDGMMMMIWVDLFVAMNVEMNWKNDANDYYDENDELNDSVSENVNESENANDLKSNNKSIIGKRIGITHLYYYCHCVFLIDCYC